MENWRDKFKFDQNINSDNVRRKARKPTDLLGSRDEGRMFNARLALVEILD